MHLFVVPTISFDLLYAFVIVRLDRGDLVWINVTKNPTAEWIARQITEAFPWDEAPKYLIRDRDRMAPSFVPRGRVTTGDDGWHDDAGMRRVLGSEMTGDILSRC